MPDSGILFGSSIVDFRCPDFVFIEETFDSTLGYPGEGPSGSSVLSGAWHTDSFSAILKSCSAVLAALAARLLCFSGSFLWHSLQILPRLPLASLLLAWVLLGGGPLGCTAMVPTTAAEIARAAERSAAEPLLQTRPTLAITERLRDRYWRQFEQWLGHEGIDFETLLLHHVECIDDINAVMARFGRALYQAGKPYNQFAETINSLTTKKPAVRRLMQGAWDVAFSWLHSEPGSHHVAMPWQVLLAVISVSLAWGWTLFAGSLALAWGALLRPGELFASHRADLPLPRDVDFTICYGLLAIREPKTRRTGARHQAAKLNVPDLLEIVDFCFGNLAPSARIWPWSVQTFRTRLRDVMNALKLPIQKIGDLKALDPGSLRSGGATWHLKMVSTPDGKEGGCRRKSWKFTCRRQLHFSI